MKRYGFIPALAGIVLALYSGCSSHAPVPSGQTVFTGIVTHQYFVQRIAGSRFHVEALIGPGADAHTFTPLPAQAAALSRARVYFRSGVEFEAGVLTDITAANPGLRVTDLAAGIAVRNMERHVHAGVHDEPGAFNDHDHHGHHEHHEADGADDGHAGHTGADPHAWMAPLTVKRQAARIRDTFKELDPAHAAQYDSAYGAVAMELDSLHAELTAMLAGLRGRDLFVFHPAFGYFADAYGLTQVAVETGGKEPGARALARLIDEVKAKNIRTLFVQPQYPARSVRAISQQSGCYVVPVGSMPVDYFKEMREMGRAVADGMKNKK